MGEEAVAGLSPRGVGLVVASWGALFFATLFSLPLALSTGLLRTAASYWAAAAVFSAASVYIVGRGLARLYAARLAEAERLVEPPAPPAACDAAASVAQAVAGFEQLASLWGLAAASLGVLGLYEGLLLYRLVVQAEEGLSRLRGVPAPRRPGLGSLAALSVATMGLGLFYVGRLVSRLVSSRGEGVAGAG